MDARHTRDSGAKKNEKGRRQNDGASLGAVRARRHHATGRKRRGRVKKGGYCHLPGDYYMVPCRALLRKYLFKPDRDIMDAFRFLFGHYAKKYGIRIYAACVMSTHYHLVLLDTLGLLPKFLMDVNRSLANVVKARYRTSGAVFEQEPSKVKLHGAKAVIEKIAYVLANPVAAGAVRDPREWPGLRTRIADMGRTTIRGDRPEHYFGRRKTLPADSSFAVEMPPIVVAKHGVEGAKVKLAKALEASIAEARAEVREKGWTYQGAARAMKVSPFKQAVACEVLGARNPDLSTFGLPPEEAARVKRDLHRLPPRLSALPAAHAARRDRRALANRHVGDGPALRPPGAATIQRRVS